MRGHRPAARLLCLALSASLASACTTVRPLPAGPAAAHEEVQPGDKLRIATHDGRKLELVVSSVTREAITGQRTRGPLLDSGEVTVPFAEIARIERAELSAGKTIVAGIAIATTAAAAAGLVFLIWIVTQVGGSSPAPAPAHALPPPRR